MSTFVGHAFAAAVVVSTSRGSLPARPYSAVTALAIAAAVLPDIDVFLVTQSGVVAHRELTHSLLFATISAAALTVVARALVDTAGLRLFLVMFLAGASHLLLDFLMGAGPPVRPFAPFDDRGFLAPVRLLPIAYYAKTADGYRWVAFWIGNGVAAALEVAILAPPLLVTNPAWRSRTRALAAALSLAAVGASLALYN
jgi:inner membrane protein